MGQRSAVPAKGLMSALGHKRTSKQVRAMSALPPKADMDQNGRDVRFVPKADIGSSIDSSARAKIACGTDRPMALVVLRLITSSYLVGACTGRWHHRAGQARKRSSRQW